MAVVLRHQHDRRRRRSALAGVPATLRPGAHIPHDQAGPRLDPAQAPRPGSGRPVDMVGHRRAYPAPARPAARRGRPPPLGTTGGTEQAHPGPGPPGFKNLRPALPCPARAPKHTRPGPGRPLGSKNQHPTTRYDAGKTVRRPESIIERDLVRGNAHAYGMSASRVLKRSRAALRQRVARRPSTSARSPSR